MQTLTHDGCVCRPTHLLSHTHTMPKAMRAQMYVGLENRPWSILLYDTLFILNNWWMKWRGWRKSSQQAFMCSTLAHTKYARESERERASAHILFAGALTGSELEIEAADRPTHQPLFTCSSAHADWVGTHRPNNYGFFQCVFNYSPEFIDTCACK